MDVLYDYTLFRTLNAFDEHPKYHRPQHFEETSKKKMTRASVLLFPESLCLRLSLRRRGGDGTNTLYDTKDAVLDCSAYLKIVFGALLGMAYAKMQTVGFAHFIVGGVVLGSIPMVLSQHWLKHPPEKSIEWGGPFALASDGIGAGLASLVVTWSVCHSAWNT